MSFGLLTSLIFKTAGVYQIHNSTKVTKHGLKAITDILNIGQFELKKYNIPIHHSSALVILQTPSTPSFIICLKSDRADLAVSKDLMEKGTFAPALLQDLLSIQPKPLRSKKFVDVGANVGFFGLYAAANGWDSTMIDVQCGNIARIQLSVALNYWSNSFVRVLRNAASAKGGEFMMLDKGDSLNPGGWGVAFASPNSRSNHSSMDGCNSVETMALDDRFSTVIDLVNIDVEGHERFVLQGMKRLLKEKKVKVIIIEFWAITGAHWLRKMISWGYSLEVVADDRLEHFKAHIGLSFELTEINIANFITSIDCDHAQHQNCNADLRIWIKN